MKILSSLPPNSLEGAIKQLNKLQNEEYFNVYREKNVYIYRLPNILNRTCAKGIQTTGTNDENIFYNDTLGNVALSIPSAQSYDALERRSQLTGG